MTGLSGDKRKEREKLLRNFSLSFSPSCPNVRHFAAERSEARNLVILMRNAQLRNLHEGVPYFV